MVKVRYEDGIGCAFKPGENVGSEILVIVRRYIRVGP